MFQVSRVAESSPYLNTGQSGSPTSTSSSPITPPSLSSSPSRFFPSSSSSRFRVTLVEPSSSPVVTSPSGNVTVGFNYKQNDSESAKQENSTAPATDTCKEKTSAPEIVVTSMSTTPQVPTSQNVKITVKLDPEGDNLIIENEASDSESPEVFEDTADLEVRRILDRGQVGEDKSWVNSNVQDSITLLRRSGRGIAATSPENENSMLVHDVDSLSMNISRTNNVNQDPVILKQDPAEDKTATESKLELKEGDHDSVSTRVFDTVDNVVKQPPIPVPTLATSPSPVQPFEYNQKNSCTKSSESQDCTKISVENNIKQPPPSSDPVASPNIPPAQRSRKISWVASDSEESLRKSEAAENSLKQPSPSPTPTSAAASVPPAQRSRKISWIASSVPEEPKSSLERLLGLFQHPGSFFKSNMQYKATSSVVNPRPVANSNASFLLASGPLANGGSSVLGSSQQERDSVDAEQTKDTSHETVAEVKISPKQSPGVLRKEKQTENCENPIPDVINNNNEVDDVTDVGAGVFAISEQLSEEGNKCITRQCEDENYNLPKSYENVIETKASDDNGTKSSSQIAQAVSVRGSGLEETSFCDSKCNVSSTQGDKAQCDSEDMDKSWSRSCESSYVQSSAATVRLVGGAPGFEFPPVDSDKDEASGVLLPDLKGVYLYMFLQLVGSFTCLYIVLKVN